MPRNEIPSCSFPVSGAIQGGGARGKVCQGEGRLLAARREAAARLLGELLPGGREEQTDGCQEEHFTWDQVVRLVQIRLVEGGGDMLVAANREGEAGTW